MLSSVDANGPHSQLFFNIVWILSRMEQQNILEVQIRQILAVTLAFKTILPRFDRGVYYSEKSVRRFLEV